MTVPIVPFQLIVVDLIGRVVFCLVLALYHSFIVILFISLNKFRRS